MRRIALALSLALGSTGLVAATPGSAEACGMYRPPRSENTDQLVADAAKAERKGELRTATRLYERVMNDGRARLDLRLKAAMKAGELQDRAGKARESLRRFQKAVELDPGSYAARMRLGHTLARRGDFEQAQTQFAVAAAGKLATSMERGNAQAALAISLTRLGRADEARSALEAARALGALAEALAEAETVVNPSNLPAVAAKM